MPGIWTDDYSARPNKSKPAESQGRRRPTGVASHCTDERPMLGDVGHAAKPRMVRIPGVIPRGLSRHGTIDNPWLDVLSLNAYSRPSCSFHCPTSRFGFWPL